MVKSQVKEEENREQNDNRETGSESEKGAWEANIDEQKKQVCLIHKKEWIKQ